MVNMVIMVLRLAAVAYDYNGSLASRHGDHFVSRSCFTTFENRKSITVIQHHESADLRVDTGLRNQDLSALTLCIQACVHTRSRTRNVLIPARLKAWSNKAFLLTLFPL